MICDFCANKHDFCRTTACPRVANIASYSSAPPNFWVARRAAARPNPGEETCTASGKHARVALAQLWTDGGARARAFQVLNRAGLGDPLGRELAELAVIQNRKSWDLLGDPLCRVLFLTCDHTPRFSVK